ncbi:protein S100-A12-like isoform X2 [Carcharodon carcharias]|nr:protein S100-A12-like isoform X2 [Carcharodon carcharias]
MAHDLTNVNVALHALLKVFKEAAASGDRDKTTLNREELHQLMKTQLPSLVHGDFEQRFEGFFRTLEGDERSNVDFKEFMCLLATIVVCCDQELSK